MIYISSAAVRRPTLIHAVKQLAENGFKCIELTAGNSLTKNWLLDLLELKEKYNLSYLCHNYFPVPEKPFVLNLASLDDETYTRSIALTKEALEVSRVLGGSKYAVHAGFRIDIPVSQIGKKIEKIDFNDELTSWERFVKSVDGFFNLPSSIERYIENNVLSAANYTSYQGKNPFYVTDKASWFQLKNEVPEAQLLLDVAHLKVSCHSLGLKFEDELRTLALSTNYIHLSDNDGLSDSNQAISKNTNWLSLMKELPLSKENIYTLEVYGGIDVLRSSYDIVANSFY